MKRKYSFKSYMNNELVSHIQDIGEINVKNKVIEINISTYCFNIEKDKVTVNIKEGTYYLGSYLKFNTNNLNIIGNGSVIIKNLYSDKEQSFGSNCNFSISISS